jgi:hypothetical protein
MNHQLISLAYLPTVVVAYNEEYSTTKSGFPKIYIELAVGVAVTPLRYC